MILDFGLGPVEPSPPAEAILSEGAVFLKRSHPREGMTQPR